MQLAGLNEVGKKLELKLTSKSINQLVQHEQANRSYGIPFLK